MNLNDNDGVGACQTCDGRGEVPTVEYADSMNGYLSALPCHDCNGTGNAGVGVAPAAEPWDGGCEHCQRTDAKPRPDDEWCEHCARGVKVRLPASEHPLLKPFADPAAGAAFAEALDQGKRPGGVKGGQGG